MEIAHIEHGRILVDTANIDADWVSSFNEQFGDSVYKAEITARDWLVPPNGDERFSNVNHHIEKANAGLRGLFQAITLGQTRTIRGQLHHVAIAEVPAYSDVDVAPVIALIGAVAIDKRGQKAPIAPEQHRKIIRITPIMVRLDRGEALTLHDMTPANVTRGYN